MRKLLALAALLVLGASNVWAGGITGTQSPSTPFRITAEVYNDSGSALTSGTVVIWDNDDTEFDENGYPYVTTSTTVDDDWTAGVILDNNCPAASMCQIVVYGPAFVNLADSTDAVTEDTAISTSSVAGMAGDDGAGANTCQLGILMIELGGSSGNDGARGVVFVNPTCT